MTRIRWIGITLLALVAVAGIAVWLLLARLGSPETQRRILEELGRRSGLEVTAESVSFGPFAGLEMHGIRLAGEQPFGSVEASADALILRHELRPLLRRELVIDTVRLVRPTIEITERSGVGPESGTGESDAGEAVAPAPESGGETAAGETGGSAFSLEVRAIALEDATLIQHSAAPEAAITLEGLDLGLQDVRLESGGGAPVTRLSAAGDLRLRRAALGESELRDASGTFCLERGRFSVDRLSARADQGDFEIQGLEVALDRAPFTYRFDAAALPLHTNVVLGAGPEGTFGEGTLELAAAGAGPEVAALEGSGVLRVGEGSLPEVPVVTRIERLLGRTALTGAAYQPFAAHYRLDGPRLVIEPFEIVTEQVTLRFGGSADLGGSALDLSVTALAAREGIAVKEIPEELLEALTEDGVVHLPIRIAGTLEQPRVALDQEALEALARSAVQRRVEDEVKKSVDKLLRGLGRKNRGNSSGGSR